MDARRRRGLGLNHEVQFSRQTRHGPDRTAKAGWACLTEGGETSGNVLAHARHTTNRFEAFCASWATLA